MYRICRTLAILGIFASPVLAADEAVINYEDHIKAIFREHCVSCHSASDKSSGLSLDNYAAALEGGSGGASLKASDSSASRLWKLVNHEEQPTMPPDQDKIDAKQLELIKTWIDQGLPENSGSQIKRKKVEVAAVMLGSNGRPEGPVPMPGDLLLETPRYTAKAAAVSAIAAAPWSPFVAIGGQLQVSLYHVETGELLGVIPFPEGEPQSITFSRDGKLMLVGGGQHSKKGIAALFDVTTGKRLTTIGDEIDIVMSADISDDNTKVAIAGPQRIVRVYEIATGNLLHELKKHTDWIYSVRFSPDGLLIASADRSNGMVVWETDTGRLYLDLLGHKSEIRSLDWRSDSMVLYSASMDGTVKMWDMNNGNIIKSWDAHGGGATAIDVANDGMIATTGRDHLVKLWDGGGNAAGQMPNLAESGMEVALSVDSKYVVAGDWLGNVRLWKRENPAEERPLYANPPTLEMQISQNGQRRDSLAASRDQLQVQFEQLMKEYTQLNSENQTTAATLENVNERVVSEQSALAQGEPKVAELQGQIASNKVAVDSKLNEQLELSDKIAVMKANQESLSKQLAALQVAPADPQSSGSEQQKQIDELNKQLGELSTNVDSATIQYQEKQKEIQTVRSQVDTMIVSLEQERNAIAVRKSTLERLTAEQAQVAQKAQELSGRLTEAATKKDTAAAQLASQNDLLAKCDSKLALLHSQSDRIESERQNHSQNVQALQQKVEQLNTGLASVTESKKTQQQSVDSKLAAITELQKKIDELLATKDGLDKERSQLDAVLSEIAQKVSDAETQIAETSSELKTATEEMERFNTAYPVK
jgi:WD40 repeat protein/mono/diheme cytochrome c family protein